MRPVGSSVLQSNNAVAEAIAISLDKPLEWAVGFFFGNVEYQGLMISSTVEWLYI